MNSTFLKINFPLLFRFHWAYTDCAAAQIVCDEEYFKK